MNKIIFSIVGLMLISIATFSQSKSFYDFTVTDIDGNPYALSQLKGKKVMVVNVASKCGYTKQYESLQAIYEKYQKDNFVIVGFPANNFLRQEPGSNEEIKSFCSINYGVTFPMMEKISVKGKDIHPVYEWLTTKELNGSEDSDVSWNFQKYLIDTNGKIEHVLSSKTKPDSEKVIDWITE